MLRTACLKKKLGIVVDCGHGGSDCGAISGCNLAEKDLTLSIGLQLADLLRADGYEVFLTRDADQTVALDERTTFANRCNADLFVSIHANHAPRKSVSGIETFCLDDALFKHCFADVDAATLRCAHQTLNHRYKESRVLATCLHGATVEAVKKKYADLVDRSVKHAVSQVLLGTTMPAILIEVGFLSNPDEVERLKKDHAQLAHALHAGIVAYDKSRMG